LPQRSEQRIGVARIENDVDPAAVAVAEQHPLPGLAAIPGAEDPALVVGPERVAERGDEHDIRVSRVDDDGADVPAVAQTQVLPALVLFQTPPATAPKYQVAGSPGTPLTATTRPPRNGPTWRHFMPLKSCGST